MKPPRRPRRRWLLALALAPLALAPLACSTWHVDPLAGIEPVPERTAGLRPVYAAGDRLPELAVAATPPALDPMARLARLAVERPFDRPTVGFEVDFFGGVVVTALAGATRPTDTMLGYVVAPGLLDYALDGDTLFIARATDAYAVSVGPDDSVRLRPTRFPRRPDETRARRHLAEAAGIVRGATWSPPLWVYVDCPDDGRTFVGWTLDTLDCPSCTLAL